MWNMCGKMETITSFFNLLFSQFNYLNYQHVCTWVCVRVRGQAVFTHPLLWLVLRMSFWPNGFWDCEAWEQISTDDASSRFHVYASGAGKDGGVGTWSARGGGRPAGRPRPAAGRRWWEPTWWWLDLQLVQTDKREGEGKQEEKKTWWILVYFECVRCKISTNRYSPFQWNFRMHLKYTKWSTFQFPLHNMLFFHKVFKRETKKKWKYLMSAKYSPHIFLWTKTSWMTNILLIFTSVTKHTFFWHFCCAHLTLYLWMS